MTYPDENAIQQRAYEIWLAEGCPEGQDEAHWHRAVSELAAADGPADPDVPGTPGSASDGMEATSERTFDGGPLEGKARGKSASRRV